MRFHYGMISEWDINMFEHFLGYSLNLVLDGLTVICTYLECIV